MSLDADGADPDMGLDSLRLNAGREDGRRNACRAEVRRPREVKWLPGPTGVGDAVAITREICCCCVSAEDPDVCFVCCYSKSMSRLSSSCRRIPTRFGGMLSC